jgi:hypothetical protein
MVVPELCIRRHEVRKIMPKTFDVPSTDAHTDSEQE